MTRWVHRARTERQRQDREWRQKKGADDLVDLALNYGSFFSSRRFAERFLRR